ncbi:MAG TPA: biotin carboxylase N-terminal domain-containing protein, partial [Spirochaetota bacterium]|nr:biotin carboxylase N-terminal domain-containing protein [Spirochaetota bacterium]
MKLRISMNDIDRSDINMNIMRAHDSLKDINPHINQGKHFTMATPSSGRKGNLQKVLIANRGEIAKRFFLALHEESIPSVAVVTDPDKGQSWYDFADEVVFIGEHSHYSDPYIIIAAAQLINANAVYSGYGFLSENPEFVRIIDTLNRTSAQPLIFMGPGFDAMDIMGHKGNARRIAKENGIPLFDSSDIFSAKNMGIITAEAGRIGYPVILKPVSGGGGKGMVTVYAEGELEPAVDSCMRTSLSLYNKPSFYIEKLIKNPVHIEVQIFNGWVIGIRKCAVQRRNQKIIEESGEIFIDETVSANIISAAEKLAEISGYSRNCGAGTVEFLIDQDTGETGFLEMNTRLQVEYAVTDQSLDIDLVKCQVQLYDDRVDEFQHLGNLGHRVTYSNHAIECRIYAEDPENGYLPSPGVIAELNLPTFNGVRCDFGFRDGDSVLPMYDPMIGKLIVHGRTRSETLIRLERALQELYIRGVKTNVPQLLRIIRHPDFIKGSYNNNFLSENSDFNRRISDYESLHGESSLHIIMGGFSEYLKLFNEKVSGFISVSAIEGIADTPVPEPDTDFTVSYPGAVFYLRFIQASINRYYSFINKEYAGTITLNFTNKTADNIIVNYKERVLRLRVDRKPGEVILRIRNDRNKISYYSMAVSADRTVQKNRTEIIRAPFQGTVVSLCKNLSAGDMIWEGDPVVILSSMKMETTICSPVDGIISYIIGAKDQGVIGGMGIHEGEVLVKIETGHDAGSSVSSSTGFFNSYFRDKLLPSVITNPGDYIQLISSIYSSLIMGYISGSYYAEIIQKIISDVSFPKWKPLINEQISDVVIRGLLHAASINRIFSRSAAGEGISFYDELNTLIHQRNADEPELSENFSSLMAELLNSYGLTDHQEINLFRGSSHFDPVIMFICMSHRFISGNPDLIKNLLYMLPHLTVSPGRLIEAADLFIDEEQNGELAITAQKSRMLLMQKSVETKENRKGLTPVLSDGCFKKSSRLKELHFRNIEFLENNYDIECIDSSAPCFPVYRITAHGREDDYIAFALIDGDTADISGLYAKIEAAAAYAISLLADLNEAGKTGYWMHIVIADTAVSIDDDRPISISRIRDSLNPLIDTMKQFSSFNGIVESVFVQDNESSAVNRKLRFYMESNRIAFEYLPESDSRSPYSLPEKNITANQRLFSLNKWPVELWAGECFDSGLYEEIRVASIDYDLCDEKRINNVGAKIYTGLIHGTEACFFMKDSRINSGSTGNPEGLKYIAASYLSIMKGIPLYVWNDGAGANIKEGVIALNRGAEGFMMNALQTGFTPGKFRSFIMHNPDQALIELFESMNKQFGFSLDSLPETPRPLSLVAVGTGSSAGLDVYGSSQAVIQVMLDSEQSYRVLTGSGVIKSIIGEDISNYE